MTLIDTRQLDWQDGPPGRCCKILERDEIGHPSLFLTHIPPGANIDRRGEVPFRHYHSDSYEHSFMLEGEFPHAEYASVEQHDAEVYIKQPGVFMRRLPGSIHGIENLFSRTGAVLLYWRSPGGGTFVGEDNYEEASPHVPYDFSKRSPRGYTIATPRPDGIIFHRPDFSAIDTRLLDWQSDLSLPGQLCKVLERDGKGEPVALILHAPPGESPELPLERCFALEGDHRGVYTRGEPMPASRTGASLLCFE